MGLSRWALGLSLLLLHVVGAGADPRSQLRYQRAVRAQGVGESCAVLDPLLFAHAAASLSDLHLLRADGVEAPYVLTLSGTAGVESETVGARDVRQRAGMVSFDLAMPARPYTDVVLDLATTNFVATARVTGGDGLANARLLPMGEFAIFDLSAEHLPRSTVLHLRESTAALLHVELRAAPGSRALLPEMVRGAVVPPSREAQTLYTAAVSTSVFVQRGGETDARLTLPARVPIERVRVVLAPRYHGNFSRALRIHAWPVGGAGGEGEVLTGTLASLHLRRDGVMLEDERLSAPATLGANLQTAAEVEVEIENGGAPALPVRSVLLETRERRLCFEAPADGASLTLFYGDPQPRLGAERRGAELRLSGAPGLATIGPEEVNRRFTGGFDRRSLTRRHPRLFSLGLILLVCLGGVVVLRSGKMRP